MTTGPRSREPPKVQPISHSWLLTQLIGNTGPETRSSARRPSLFPLSLTFHYYFKAGGIPTCRGVEFVVHMRISSSSLICTVCSRPGDMGRWKDSGQCILADHGEDNNQRPGITENGLICGTMKSLVMRKKKKLVLDVWP